MNTRFQPVFFFFLEFLGGPGGGVFEFMPVVAQYRFDNKKRGSFILDPLGPSHSCTGIFLSETATTGSERIRNLQWATASACDESDAGGS